MLARERVSKLRMAGMVDACLFIRVEVMDKILRLDVGL